MQNGRLLRVVEKPPERVEGFSSIALADDIDASEDLFQNRTSTAFEIHQLLA
ncbi:hypothetical protein D3C87_2074020 [compost metagenome]